MLNPAGSLDQAVGNAKNRLKNGISRTNEQIKKFHFF